MLRDGIAEFDLLFEISDIQTLRRTQGQDDLVDEKWG